MVGVGGGMAGTFVGGEKSGGLWSRSSAVSRILCV